jgi:hypothetical protein
MNCGAELRHAEILRSNCDSIQPITVAVRAVKVMRSTQRNGQPSVRMCRSLTRIALLNEQRHEADTERVTIRRNRLKQTGLISCTIACLIFNSRMITCMMMITLTTISSLKLKGRKKKNRCCKI